MYVHGLGDAQEAEAMRYERDYGWLDKYSCKCPNCGEEGQTPFDYKYDDCYGYDDEPDMILIYECQDCGHEWEEYA